MLYNERSSLQEDHFCMKNAIHWRFQLLLSLCVQFVHSHMLDKCNATIKTYSPTVRDKTKQKKSKCWSGISVWSCNTTLLLNPALVYSADNKRIHILESFQIITETLRMMICHIWQQLRQIKRLPLCFSSKGWKYETANSRNLKLDLIDFHYMIC